MRLAHPCLASLAFAVSLVCAPDALGQRIEARGKIEDPVAFRTKTATSAMAARLVPLDALTPALRERVQKTLYQPTLVAHAPAEEFIASPKLYRWLLDHPDRTANAWQRLGVPCQPITERGNGRFAWTDDQSSEIVWFPIADGPGVRIWYAEGQVRPAALLPLIPVKAVVVIRYDCAQTDDVTKIRHEVDAFCQADSRAAQVATRLFGASTERVADQSAQQLLMFFGSIAQYVGRNPEKTAQLLAPATPPRHSLERAKLR